MITRRLFLQALTAIGLAPIAKLAEPSKFSAGEVLVTPTSAPVAQEYVMGLRRMGPLTMTMNFDQQPNLPLGDVLPVKVELPDRTVLEMDGIVREYMVDGNGMTTLSIQPTGQPTISAEEIPADQGEAIEAKGTRVTLGGVSGELYELSLPTFDRNMIDATSYHDPNYQPLPGPPTGDDLWAFDDDPFDDYRDGDDLWAFDDDPYDDYRDER